MLFRNKISIAMDFFKSYDGSIKKDAIFARSKIIVGCFNKLNEILCP